MLFFNKFGSGNADRQTHGVWCVHEARINKALDRYCFCRILRNNTYSNISINNTNINTYVYFIV